jgi:hypothetical protein
MNVRMSDNSPRPEHMQRGFVRKMLFSGEAGRIKEQEVGIQEKVKLEYPLLSSYFLLLNP